MVPIHFTGSADSRCPITHKSLSELRCPVAFRDTPQHAYECDDLLHWLETKATNPMTNTEVHHWRSLSEVIAPLAGITDPDLAFTKLDAMVAEYWTISHAALFLLVTTNVLAPNYRIFGDLFAIAFAIGHWSWNAWNVKGKRQLAFVAMLMLCAGNSVAPA